MSLGVGIFASVILILAVYHKGFRKVLFWTAGVVVVLTLLGAGGYFAYDRYTTWQADRVAQKQKAATDKGIRTCMTRLATPMPPEGSAPTTLPAAYFDNLAACAAYPDVGIPTPPQGFIPDSLPSGYMLDPSGKVVPITIDLSGGLVAKKNTKDRFVENAPKKDTRRILMANVTCDVIVYDRDEYAVGDRQAIDSLHTGDVGEYIGASPSGAAIIRVHGRRGYVVDLPGCIEVIR